MPHLSDEQLIALLDREMDAAEQAAAEAALAQDGALRDRFDALALSTSCLRGAFDSVLHEPVPNFLITAARGAVVPNDSADNVVPLVPKRRSFLRSRWMPVALAASICGLLIGAGGGYYGVVENSRQAASQATSSATSNLLDNLAGYYKLVHGGPATDAAYDIPADGADATQKRFPSEIKVPDLKPWGLTFQGARLIVVEGSPAAQLSYATENKELGPLTVVFFSSKRPDAPQRIEQKQGVNLLYWRHAGKAVALVSGGDKDYMWKLGNDIGYQLGAL